MTAHHQSAHTVHDAEVSLHVANTEVKKETFLIKKAFNWCLCFAFAAFLVPNQHVGLQ